MQQAKFTIGQMIHHVLFNYRGVIVDVDYKFLGSNQWYEQVALSRPPKNQPWYHVLVDNATHQTYAAEQNLKLSDDLSPIHHPLVEHYFVRLENGLYIPKARRN
jgi:heat shock protein HspQ